MIGLSVIPKLAANRLATPIAAPRRSGTSSLGSVARVNGDSPLAQMLPSVSTITVATVGIGTRAKIRKHTPAPMEAMMPATLRPSLSATPGTKMTPLTPITALIDRILPASFNEYPRTWVRKSALNAMFKPSQPSPRVEQRVTRAIPGAPRISFRSLKNDEALSCPAPDRADAGRSFGSTKINHVVMITPKTATMVNTQRQPNAVLRWVMMYAPKPRPRRLYPPLKMPWYSARRCGLVRSAMVDWPVVRLTPSPNPSRSRKMNSDRKFQAVPRIAEMADAAYMPITRTFLRPTRSDTQPLSQAETAHASDVPETSSPACQNSRWNSCTIGGRTNPMPTRLSPTKPNINASEITSVHS